MITLADLNAMSVERFVAALAGIFEHSAWIPQQAAARRPFASLVALHAAMCSVVSQSDPAAQLTLIRAHPELAGRAAIAGTLTSASSNEQRGAGLSACTPAQHGELQSLNSSYNLKFGFPFVLAVKGHTPDSVIGRLRERVLHELDVERRVALAEIFRIARFRLADLVDEPWGTAIVAMAEELAAISESPDMLVCSYLTDAHVATAGLLRDHMLAAGLQTRIDAVGNVIGILPGASDDAPLLTGSHYDTVIDAGRFDGRLGILLPIVVAGSMRRAGRVPPRSLEIIAFAEEEGVRFKSTFLGSRAIAGRFEAAMLDACDARGTSLREALARHGCTPADIDALAREPARIAAFIEVHIEQGPVLLDAAEAIGVVASIAGSIRSTLSVHGQSGHSGTVPMSLRHDAAAAAAEIVLAVESRCRRDGLVGTVGQLGVPNGAINVIPGRCDLSIDVRSGSDALRDAAVADIDAAIRAIAERRDVKIESRRVLEISGAPCSQRLQDALQASARRVTGRAVPSLPSGAGHDAMMMAGVTEIGMLFVRCGNGGISHHPDEIMSAADADLAARVLEDFVWNFQ
jgi:N-carbamoyl-L-amino-acid hydrolase